MAKDFKDRFFAKDVKNVEEEMDKIKKKCKY